MCRLAARRSLVTLVVAAVGVVSWSCATIMQGSKQKVPIESTPSGAMVAIDQQERSHTPLVATLSRKSPHVMRIVLEGYQPDEMTVARKTSGWVWGNVLLGGLIGLAVDASSGGMYKLEPAQVDATLEAQMHGPLPVARGDGLAILVVLRADSAWVPIGQLSPIQ